MNLYATEKEIQAAILDYLETIGAVAIRVNSGMQFIQDSNGGTRVFRGAKKGCPDILVCWRGRFIGIEVKSRRGKVTSDQNEFHQTIIAAGGLVLVARTIADVESFILAIEPGA